MCHNAVSNWTIDEIADGNVHIEIWLPCHIHIPYAYACCHGVCRLYHNFHMDNLLIDPIFPMDGSDTTTSLLEINTAVLAILRTPILFLYLFQMFYTCKIITNNDKVITQILFQKLSKLHNFSYNKKLLKLKLL